MKRERIQFTMMENWFIQDIILFFLNILILFQYYSDLKSKIIIILQHSSILRRKMGCQFSQSNNINQPHSINYRNRRTHKIDARKLSTQVMDKIIQNVNVIDRNLDQAELQFAIKCLSTHQFFSALNQDEINQIVKTIIIANCKKEQYVFKQGDPGNNFFIIFKGEVQVEKNSISIRILNKGKSFGQLALIFKTQRTASIKCKSDQNVFFILKPASFRESLKKMKVIQFQKNRKMIESAHIFNALSNKQKQILSQHLKSIKFHKDETIFNTGEPALSFYIISSGQVCIQIENKQPLLLKKLDSFGQNAFKNNSLRVGKAIAKEQTICCFLDKTDLENIFGRKFDNIFHYNLKKWALMRSKHLMMDNYSVNYLITKFELKHATTGQVLVESLPTGLIINLEGNMNGKPPGTLFCEKSFQNRTLLSHPIIKNDQGSYAFLSFENLDNIMREIQEKKLLKGYSNPLIPLQKQNFFCNLTKFKYIKELGSGQFGKVYLVKNNQSTDCLYALKCLSKQQIKKQAMQKCVIQQKKILSSIIFPYIVGYVQSFHDQKNIYILMEYIKGKEMFDVIRQLPFLNKRIATYFFGCILLAIQHLHEHNIIYRDIKPENSVVDYTGKVFLIDLGTAKVLKKDSFYKTFTLIGTPHYMAPQIMDGKGYSFEVDIWSLGVLLYEFTCGHLPFAEEDSDPYVVMRKIRTEQLKYPSSANVSNDMKQLLVLLMQKNPKVRSVKATFQRIKSSAYFQDLDWKTFFNGKISKPYIPKDFRNHSHQTMKIQGKHLGEFLYGKSIYEKGWMIKEWNQEFDFSKIKGNKDNKKNQAPFHQIHTNNN